MIIEGLITTTDEQGQINLAPMGPLIDGDNHLILRPWRGSTTFQNLCTTNEAVFHVVDDVELIAESAIRRLTKLPEMNPALNINGQVLKDCCRWLELKVVHRDLSGDRAEIQTQIVHTGTGRPFTGFNRASHAILEAAILATRVDLLEADDILMQFGLFHSAVEKTGTDRHRQTFLMLTEFVHDRISQKVSRDAD